MSDPKYVRLREDLAGGICADIYSGWSIAGYDVLAFPTDQLPAEFVQGKLRAGILESASKAEFDEVQESDKRSQEAAQPAVTVEVVTPHQEHRIQAEAKSSREKLQKLREDNPADEDDEEEDEKEKKK